MATPGSRESIDIDLNLWSQEFDKKLDKADKDIDKVLKDIERMGETAGGKAEAGVGKLTGALGLATTAGSFFGNVLANAVQSGLSGMVSTISEAIQKASDYDTTMTGLVNVAGKFNISANDARAAIQSYTKDGLVPASAAAEGFKNLVSTGFSLPEATKLMNAFKDSAAFGAQGTLSMGEAIARTTQGIKYMNSALTDNAGLGKNISVILKEQGINMSDVGSLTENAAARQAIYNGFLKEAALFSGDAEAKTRTYGGAMAQLSNTWDLFLITLGHYITRSPVVVQFIKAVQGVVEDMTGSLGENDQGLKKVNDSMLLFMKGAENAIVGIKYLAEAFYLFRTGVYEVISILYEGAAAMINIIAVSAKISQTIPGNSLVFGDLTKTISQLKGEYDSAKDSAKRWDDSARQQQKTNDEVQWSLLKIQSRLNLGIAAAEKAASANQVLEESSRGAARAAEEHADKTGETAKRLAETEKAVRGLTAAQIADIEAGRKLGDSAKEIAKNIGVLEDVVKLYIKHQQEATKATKEHQRELDRLSSSKAQREIEQLSKDIDDANQRGMTAHEVYDEFGKKLIEAGRDVDRFNISVDKIPQHMQAAIESARQFKIGEILARANADMQKELQRIIKESTEQSNRQWDQQERRIVESNERVLRYHQELQDARAQATLKGVDLQIYELNRWRTQEKAGLDKSSADYQLLVGQIDQLYSVRLRDIHQNWAREHGLTWDRAKDAALGAIETVKSAFTGSIASMITGQKGFKDGFLDIWNSIKQSVTNILQEILNYYLGTFIAKMAGAILGGRGGITGTILNAAGIGGGGGGGGIPGVNGGGGTTNWLMQALGLGGGGAIGGTTSLAGAAALMPALSSGGIGAAGAGLASTSLAGVSGTMPAIPSASGFGAAGAGGGGLAAGLAGGALAGGAGLGLGLLGTQIFGGAGWKASGFGAGTGAAAGALIGSVVPVIGTAVGAIVGGLAGFIGGWIGKSVGEKINDKRDELLKQFGGAGTGEGSGFANVSADTARMDRLGMDGQETWRLIFQPKNWDDFNEGVRRLQAAFQDLRFVQDKVTEAFGTLQAEGQKAMEQGASEIDVLKAQSAGYNEIYQTIMRTGAEAPAGFGAVAKKLIELGLLVDENGQKVEDMSAFYTRGAQTIVEGIKDVTTAQQKLREQSDQLIEQGYQQEEVARIQADAYSELYQRILSTGERAPDAMKPALQSLIDLGLLVDAQGQKVTELGDIFQTTAADGQAMGDQLQDSVASTAQAVDKGAEGWRVYKDRGVAASQTIAEAMRGTASAADDAVADMQQAFDEFRPRPVRVPVEWERPEDPSSGLVAHTGGYIDYGGLRRFHSGGLSIDERLAVVQTGEGVLSRRGMRNLAQLNLGPSEGSGGLRRNSTGGVAIHAPIYIEGDFLNASGTRRMLSQMVEGEIMKKVRNQRRISR